MLMILLMISEVSRAAVADEPSPITASLSESKDFATFANRLHTGNRIGYRFHEHTPMISGETPAGCSAAGIDPEAVAQSESSFARRPGVLKHSLTIARLRDWIPQRWTFYLSPVADGVDMLWVVETFETGLSQYYGVQQCFRMGGNSNQAWRRAIAETPAFSEFDLWDVTEKDAAAKTSLTYVLRKGTWMPLPAVRDTVGARTPLGLTADKERSGGDIDSMREVGPYHARMLEPIDNGLITRMDKDQTWVCGIYWQHTSHVTDHHPADCLHSIVNVGGIPPQSKRALRGKIYWFKGSLEDLAEHWRRDFPTE